MLLTKLSLCALVLYSIDGNAYRLKRRTRGKERNSNATSIVEEAQDNSSDIDIDGNPIRRLMGTFTDVVNYGLTGTVSRDLNNLPRNPQKDRSLHFSFATQLGTELGYAYPVMLMLVQKGHDVTFCARTFQSPYHSITPGLSENLVRKLTLGGVKIVEPPHESRADVNAWWRANYDYKVDLFIEDILTIDVGKPPTMMVAEATNSPLSLWVGNSWLLWMRIQKGLFPPPLPNTLYPSFVASWHGSWDPPPMFKAAGLTELEHADTEGGDMRWRIHHGARVGYVRASVAAVGAPNPDEKIELDKIAAAVAKNPEKKIVLFVLGTQGSKLSFGGYKKIIEDLAKLDIICVFVLAQPIGWDRDWANTIQPETNLQITEAWKAWYRRGGAFERTYRPSMPLAEGTFLSMPTDDSEPVQTHALPDNFIFTTYVPQAQLLSLYGDRTIMISGMGASSLAEAIDAEVPVLGFPVQADQPENSRMVQELQVGVNRSAFVTELWTLGHVEKPYGVYGKIWRKLVGEKHVTNAQMSGIGHDLSDAVNHVTLNWDTFKASIRELKVDLSRLTFSQEEVANQYIAMLKT
jgi:hypothetical protein